LGALSRHPRRGDVRARLVEQDPRLAARARLAGEAIGATVEVVEGDAARPEAYADAVPADLVMVCGVFGNVPDADVAHVVGALAAFTKVGGTVIWTRHRGEPDLVPAINTWFAEHGFELVWLSDKDVGYGVGVHRFGGTPQPLRTGGRLFQFVGAP
jgi:hypothetical protein